MKDQPGYLDKIVRAQKRGEARGVYSICSANPFAIEASLRRARDGETPILIESTCNQVNQYGGYTGMTPGDFVEFVRGLAEAAGTPRERIIFGGDHLGPGVWKDSPADTAMDRAQVMVRDYLQAGYSKVHLDASTKCADDPPGPVDKGVSAERAAELAWVAEETYAKSGPGGVAPRYVIGTEVPPPGGVEGEEEEMRVTRTTEVEETIGITWERFTKRGLEAAWERVVAIVVQPGVEFGDDRLFEYDPEQAAALSWLIEGYDQLVYEAHSTDYQRRSALRRMVVDHFAILKVGPALTFALREVVFGLAMIEGELFSATPEAELSRVRQALETAMLTTPVHWEKYYRGSELHQRMARKYSFSDRARYYWPVPEVQSALGKLMENLEARPIPLSLLSQFLPEQYGRIRDGALANNPRAMIMDKIAGVIDDYAFACGERGGGRI